MSVDLAESRANTTTPIVVTTSADPTGPATPVSPRPVHIDPMLRLGNAFYLAIHGVAHAAGTAALWGRPELSTAWATPTGTAAVAAALAWALIGIGFLLSALLLAVGRGWRPVLTATTTASLVACLLFLPATWPGLAANALVVLGLVASRPRQ